MARGFVREINCTKICLIEKTTNNHVGTIGFRPRKGERISMKGYEFIVEDILNVVQETGATVMVFVSFADPKYTNRIPNITWME